MAETAVVAVVAATDESSIFGAICGGSVASFSFISFTGSVTLATAAADVADVDDFSISSVALSDGAEPVRGIFHIFFSFSVCFWTLRFR